MLAPSHDASRPFSGLDVATTAGLRLRPGSLRPRFDQDLWDLSGLADAPVVMSAHRKILDFTRIAHPRWRIVAREYLMARLAPRHPAVATLPGAFRIAMNPHTLWKELDTLAGWFNFLTASGVTSLRDVDQRHCDAFLETASRSTVDPRRRLAPVTIATAVRTTRCFVLYAGILSDHYRRGFVPWAGRSADTVAGYVRTSVNQVSPVADSLLRPLLAGALYLVDTIGPHLTHEASAARAADRLEAASLRCLRHAERDTMRTALEEHRRAGMPAVLVDPATCARRLNMGWDPNDPLLRVAWHPVVVAAAGAMGHRRDLEALRPELEQWVRECGVEEPWCRNASLVPRHDTGAMVAWAPPMNRMELTSAIYAVTSACFYLTSALSGMRASELAELTAGCRQQEERTGGVMRFHLTTRRIKGEAFGGSEDSWVVIEDVARAIGMAESLNGAGAGELLFSKASNNANRRYASLRCWINGLYGQRLGLEPIPDGPMNPRALRRTLALTIAQRPHGLMAAKVHLKHVSVATTEGYAARPGGHQAAFMAEITAQEEAEHMRLTVAAYEDYKRGILPSGKGARDLVASFRAADQALAGQDPGPGTVIDDRRVEHLLKARAESLYVGVANYCWFTDPGKALCLKMAGTPDASEPLIGMCDSARCPQATHHPQHRQVWADHAQHTQAVFLGNPRLSRPERARAEVAFDRAMRIVGEIDATATPAAKETDYDE
jgi:hypothetical protein